MPGGYFGRALVVQLDDGSSSVLELPEPVLRAYLGGSGLGTWLMHRLRAAGRGPARPRGSPGVRLLPAGGHAADDQREVRRRRQVAADGMLNDALSSSHFAISGKLTGYDAIVVRGRCAAPSVLLVDGAGARLVGAADVWGLPAAEAERGPRRRPRPGLEGRLDRPGR